MATTTANACGCGNPARGAEGGLTGRLTREPVRNYWPSHDLSVRTDFISERNRTALMWKL